MPTLVLASERMTRSVITSRLATAAGALVRRETVFVVAVGVVPLVVTDLVDADFDEEDFEEYFDLRVFFVLYGFATGARLMVPSGSVRGFVVLVVLVVASIAYDAMPVETARVRRNTEMRRSNIYCTPRSLAGWAEVSEMTGGTGLV
jgi:hypothetical protein